MRLKHGCEVNMPTPSAIGRRGPRRAILTGKAPSSIAGFAITKSVSVFPSLLTSFVLLIGTTSILNVGQYHRLRQTSWESQKGLENVYYNAWLGFTLQYPLLLAPLTPDDKAETIARKIRVVATFLDILTREAALELSIHRILDNAICYVPCHA